MLGFLCVSGECSIRELCSFALLIVDSVIIERSEVLGIVPSRVVWATAPLLVVRGGCMELYIVKRMKEINM
jgi:hypothetical protein